MPRLVTAEMDLDLAAPVDLVFQLAAVRHTGLVEEELTFASAQREYTALEIVDPTGSRLHRFTAEPGELSVRYRATVAGRAAAEPVSELDLISYLRPSRYCQSDELFAHARRQFRGLHGVELLQAVTASVADGVAYSPGLSLGTDSAVTTLATGQGVCRDFAHLVIALLRAMDVPARYTACYAPGLVPMDFHAVAEAYLDGAWYVVDATRLSDRRSLVRIATGRDAADCAFLSFHGGYVGLNMLRVDAWQEPDDTGAEASAPDDHVALVEIG